jgi:hypothetical protein
MVLRASGLIFIVCGLGIFLGGTEGVGSRFHVLRSRTHFRRYQGRRVRFSCFVLPESFWAVSAASSPVFMFYAHGLVWGCTEGARPHFHVLRSRNGLGTYQRRKGPFSSFSLPDMFLAVSRASGPVFIFCAPRLILGGTVGDGSRFHVLRSRTRFRQYRGHWVPFS